MGRHPEPSSVQRQKGAYKKDPQRENKLEPQPTAGRPEASDDLLENPKAYKKWLQVLDWLEDMEVLTLVDSDVIEAYAFLHVKIAETRKLVDQEGEVIEGARQDGGMVRNPRFIALTAMRADQLKLMTQLGLSPSSRTKLKRIPKKDDGIFSELMKRKNSIN